MKNSIKTIAALMAIVLLSCGNSAGDMNNESQKSYNEDNSAPYEETSEMVAATETEGSAQKKESMQSENHQQSITSLAASMVNDGNMRFIRKANLTYKTESVRNTTYYLENAVVNLGGIVTYTNLYSEIESVKKIAISNDSSLKVTTYQMKNNMTVRIPNTQLDSLLKVISKSVVFLDERIITANEISLIELKNQLEQKRMAQYQNQLKEAISDKSGKMNQVVDAYENMLHKQKLEDEALIRNLELDYEVDYSTVQLMIYQDVTMDKELVENELNIEEFQPSFFSQLGESLLNGWKALLFFVVELANLWFFIIVVIAGIVIYKRRKKQI